MHEIILGLAKTVVKKLPAVKCQTVKITFNLHTKLQSRHAGVRCIILYRHTVLGVHNIIIGILFNIYTVHVHYNGRVILEALLDSYI